MAVLTGVRAPTLAIISRTRALNQILSKTTLGLKVRQVFIELSWDGFDANDRVESSALHFDTNSLACRFRRPWLCR